MSQSRTWPYVGWQGRNDTDDGGLAGAVWTYQSIDHPGLDLERYVIDCGDVFVVDAQAFTDSSGSAMGYAKEECPISDLGSLQKRAYDARRGAFVLSSSARSVVAQCGSVWPSGSASGLAWGTGDCTRRTCRAADRAKSRVARGESSQRCLPPTCSADLSQAAWAIRPWGHGGAAFRLCA